MREIKKRLDNRNLRGTYQRVAVMKVLSETKSHPDAKWIYRKVRKEYPSISLATVYSTLRTLKSKGIVQEVSSFGESRRFDGDPSPHSHLVCLECGRIDDIKKPGEDISRLTGALAEKTGYNLLEGDITFRGYCPYCAEEKEKRWTRMQE